MRFAFSFLLLLLSAFPAASQAGKDIPTKVITISNTRLKDCLVNSKYAWMLREDGAIIRADITKQEVVDSLKFSNRINAIGLWKDTVYAADEKGGIFKIHDRGDTSFLWQTHQQVIQFCFSPNDLMFIVVDKGIYVPAFERLFYENAHSNPFVSRFNSYSWRPATVFVDSKDNIWLGFSAGEWGGDIVSFSMKQLRFSVFRDKYPNCYANPVRAIFEADSVLHFTGSLQHMTLLRSNIWKVGKDACRNIFESPVIPNTIGDTLSNVYQKQELYLGPTIYNSADRSIYFYCQFGVFKGSIDTDLSKLANWQRVMETKLMWHYGMPDAVGYAMNVTKLFFTGNTLVLVSPANGIQLYDGKQLIFYKTSYKPAD